MPTTDPFVDFQRAFEENGFVKDSEHVSDALGDRMIVMRGAELLVRFVSDRDSSKHRCCFNEESGSVVRRQSRSGDVRSRSRERPSFRSNADRRTPRHPASRDGSVRSKRLQGDTQRAGKDRARSCTSVVRRSFPAMTQRRTRPRRRRVASTAGGKARQRASAEA